MIGDSAFGRICVAMMRGSDSPRSTAACTNSRARSDRNSPRTIRATGGQLTTPMATTIDAALGVNQHDEQYEVGDGLKEYGDAHQRIINQAAIVAGAGADGHTDRHRNQ